MDVSILRARARFTNRVRSFFVSRGYLEVDTPALAPALIPEPALEVFSTKWIDPRTHRERDLYLVPSPELWMKRLLAGGSGSIFQICHAFRNFESMGRYHNPEFTILEWYTVGHNYHDSILVMEDLLKDLAAVAPDEADLHPPARLMKMDEAFHHHTGLHLEKLEETDSLREAARGLGLGVSETDTWEQLFNLIFVARVEPELPTDKPLVLMDYPSRVPTLAKSRGRTCERWELYLRGVEVANCYTEERDPERVRWFFRAESLRKKGALVPHRVDRQLEELMPALPQCSGVALGMDRLLLLYSGLRSVDGVIPYTFREFPPEDGP